jgi:hypothetical protein
MFDFFNFFSMADDYEDRKVARYESGEIIVSTAFTTDTEKYETAISHPKYNDGLFVIVEEYDERESAEMGHEKWVGVATRPVDQLPDHLLDVSTFFFATLLDLVDDEWRAKKENTFIEEWET